MASSFDCCLLTIRLSYGILEFISTPIVKLDTHIRVPSEAKMIGLSGRETSVKQKTSASPSDASISCVELVY